MVTANPLKPFAGGCRTRKNVRCTRVVGRGGLEPPTSAVIGAERCASRVGSRA